MVRGPQFEKRCFRVTVLARKGTRIVQADSDSDSDLRVGADLPAACRQVPELVPVGA